MTLLALALWIHGAAFWKCPHVSSVRASPFAEILGGAAYPCPPVPSVAAWLCPTVLRRPGTCLWVSGQWLIYAHQWEIWQTGFEKWRKSTAQWLWTYGAAFVVIEPSPPYRWALWGSNGKCRSMEHPLEKGLDVTQLWISCWVLEVATSGSVLYNWCLDVLQAENKHWRSWQKMSKKLKDTYSRME